LKAHKWRVSPRVLRSEPSNQAGVATSLAKQGLAAKYAYTFRDFAAVARCVEVVTGKRFPEILEEKLLKPLGMSNTTFQPNLELLKRHPRYAKHIANLDDEKISAFLEKKKRESKRFVNAAGGLISTPDDLVKFYRLHSLRGKTGAKHGGSAGRVARDGFGYAWVLDLLRYRRSNRCSYRSTDLATRSVATKTQQNSRPGNHSANPSQSYYDFSEVSL
jgi:CubicO group peptidase (beta-lactamase class C family)